MKIQQAVQQLEQQFLEFDSSPENLSAENLATIVANVIAKKAAVTSATISYKMEEIYDSSKFKYKWVNVSLENDEGVKNLQLPVIIPKEILESSDLVAQVCFSVVNVLWYNFLTFGQVILGTISHHYLSLYWHGELITCRFMDSKLIFLLFKFIIANTVNFCWEKKKKKKKNYMKYNL